MRTVLVVDDEAQIRKMLIKFLNRNGYTAHEAEGGAQGLSLVRTLKPQVILLDISMPGMDGIETLKRLRQEQPESTIIMISGHADRETALQALDLGAHDFIEKPLDFDYLKRTLLVKMLTADAN